MRHNIGHPILYGILNNLRPWYISISWRMFGVWNKSKNVILKFIHMTLPFSQNMNEIFTIFGSYFGRNDDSINSFWNLLTFKGIQFSKKWLIVQTVSLTSLSLKCYLKDEIIIFFIFFPGNFLIYCSIMPPFKKAMSTVCTFLCFWKSTTCCVAASPLGTIHILRNHL